MGSGSALFLLFVQDMARLMVRNMERHGTRVHHNSSPMQVHQLDNRRLNVFWQHTKRKETEEVALDKWTVIRSVDMCWF